MTLWHDLVGLAVLVGAARLGWNWPPWRRKQPKRPGYIDRRPGFGKGINHPTFTEVRRGLHAARRMRRNHY